MEGSVRQVKQKAFTLLEVLIAVGVLFIIGAAVVSLSNTLIRGTVSTADATVANLWAVEGLELVTKHRDDRVKAADNQTWLSQAQDYRDYGWYYVELDPQTHDVTLTRAVFNGNPNYLGLTKAEAYDDADPSSALKSEALEAKRLICVEAIGVPSINQSANTDRLRCNMDRTSDQAYDDGSRQVSSTCANNDIYCVMTRASLERNTVIAPIIPSGNAVKVRAVIVWPTQFGYRTTEMSTVLTNWKGSDL
jgi:type II secretory pathway pseudopilin PulG